MSRVVLASSPLVGPNAMAALGEHLDALPSEDGVLPPWPDWWPPDVVASLIPDARARAAFRAACLRLRRSTLSVPIPAPEFSGPCGFVGFGDGYAAHAAEARRRGWPTTVIDDAHHLWPIVEPAEVAEAVVEMVRRLNRS